MRMEQLKKIMDGLRQLGRPMFNWRQCRFYLLAYCIGFIVAIYVSQFVRGTGEIISTDPTSPTGVHHRMELSGEMPLIGKAPYRTTFGYGTDRAGNAITTKPTPNYLLHNILDESGIPKIYVKALGRLGNCLFTLISGYSIAAETKHQLVLADGFRWLQPIFPNLNLTYEEIPKNVPRISQGDYATFQTHLIDTIPPHDVLVDGYLQSYKFSVNHTAELKHRLQFSEDVLKRSLAILGKVAKFAQQVHGKDCSVTYVGIHIRRGDLVRADKINVGYFVVDADYLEKSMLYFRLRYQKVVFIVCSDDMHWCIEAMAGDDIWFQEQSVPAEVDLSLLSMCNHTIMSVGTFGWAAGWMAGGEVMYYDPPVNASRGVGHGFTSADYYLPDWLPINKYNLTYIQKLARTLLKRNVTTFLSYSSTTSTPSVTESVILPAKPTAAAATARVPTPKTVLSSTTQSEHRSLASTSGAVGGADRGSTPSVPSKRSETSSKPTHSLMTHSSPAPSPTPGPYDTGGG